MTPGRRLALATALAGLALAGWIAFTLLLLGSTLKPAQRLSLLDLFAPRAALLGLAWALGVAAIAAALRAAQRRWVIAPRRLLERAQVLVAAPAPQQLPEDGPAELRGLAAAVNALAAQRDALRADLQARMSEAAAGLQQERNRLAALVAELAQGVLVCSLDGRIALYNPRARQLLRDCSGAPAVAGGAELVGLGRSIYAVFDRHLVAHALEVIEGQMLRGEATASAQFVTASGGGLLRAQVAPVRGGGDAAIEGFVLLLEDVTRSFEEEELRERLLYGLTERQRASLAHMGEALRQFAAEPAQGAARHRALEALRHEVDAMAHRVSGAARQAARPRWALEEMPAQDLLAVARRRMASLCGRPVAVEGAGEGLWLCVESFSLVQALAGLAARLVEEFDVRALALRMERAGERAHLDVVWTGHVVSSETVAGWETEPLRLAGQASALTLRDVLRRHGAELRYERDRRRHAAWFRLDLPLAGAPSRRPDAGGLEAYDFSLLAAAPADARLDDTPLDALAYTVFDTETTGLEPARGDAILQIGAVRVVNGRLLAQEAFEQLVDPGRPIPAASIPIHGITPERVAGQPPIEQVLPTFHAYARDTVLVAHNAAFDMKFLQLLQSRTGLAFHQPVLDTLLLSALLHPYQPSHRLEALAERFGLPVQGRHTALGDAMLTAQVLLRLLPLLRDAGIRTLGEARAASQRTWQARLKY